MTEYPISPRMAVKLSAMVPENGELHLALPFAAGQTVEIFVVAEGILPALQGEVASLVTPHEGTGAEAEGSEGDSPDPRRVSEVLRELSDELISRYEMLFRVERKADDTPPPTA